MGLGERIREAREKARLSQADLGAKLDKHRNTIASYESNTAAPSAKDIVKIADICKVVDTWLLTGEGAKLTMSEPNEQKYPPSQKGLDDIVSDIGNNNEQIIILQSQIREKDTVINSLKKEIELLNSKINDLSDRVLDKDQFIELLKKSKE